MHVAFWPEDAQTKGAYHSERLRTKLTRNREDGANYGAATET